MITIIVPVYQTERYLSRCIDSILAQSFHDFELLLIDDGSKDKSVAICERYAQKDSRVKVFQKEHSGVSDTRNFGLDHAKGDYIAFVDSDDMLAADFLERSHSVAVQTGADLVIGGEQYLEQLPETGVIQRAGAPQIQIYKSNQLETLKPHLLGPTYQIKFDGGSIGRGPIARLVRTSIAKNNLFNPELKLGEDITWNLQLCNQAQSICLVMEQWYFYWINPNSTTHRFSMTVTADYEAHFHALMKILDLSDDILYLSYIDRLKESLRHIWNCCAKQLKKQDPAAYHQLTERIYNGQIWSILGDQRLYRLSGLKGKLFVLAYRKKILFDYYRAKEIIKDHIHA